MSDGMAMILVLQPAEIISEQAVDSVSIARSHGAIDVALRAFTYLLRVISFLQPHLEQLHGERQQRDNEAKDSRGHFAPADSLVTLLSRLK